MIEYIISGSEETTASGSEAGWLVTALTCLLVFPSCGTKNKPPPATVILNCAGAIKDEDGLLDKCNSLIL
jgi:hypothetical protein